MGLTFNADVHEYRLDDHVLPSITQILKATNVMHLDPSIPPHRLEFARERGQAVHLAIRFASEGRLDASSVSAIVEPFLFAFESFCAKHAGDFEPTLVEVPMCDPVLGVAGTADAIGPKSGVLSVVEVKTGAELPHGTAVQTAAQRQIAMANGHKVVRRYGLHLRPDGTFRLQEFRDPGDDAEWRGAVYLYMRRWAREGTLPHAA